MARNSSKKSSTDKSRSLGSDVVHLARLALAGRERDIQLLLRTLATRHRVEHEEMAQGISALLREAPTRSSPLRKLKSSPLPVDVDSKLHLLRVETPVHLPIEPVLDAEVERMLRQLVAERDMAEALEREGLAPTRTVLFTGPPGVGKTLAARWLARELGIPLLTLDLSAVMSSFLGRTGTNVRQVLDYAKGMQCVLLLDELDAVAKRRDDATEVGELKRLVTVLLQEIDDWPVGPLLVAATNHAALLDPAVWRRFEVQVKFPLPSDAAVRQAVWSYASESLNEDWLELLSLAFEGASFSDIERGVMQIRRSATLAGDEKNKVVEEYLRAFLGGVPRGRRIDIAAALTQAGVSQRRARELTGVSRDTIRNRLNESREN